MEYDPKAEALKPWSQVIKEREIRECRRCTAVIANHLAYGRQPRPDDPTLCECCEGPDPETCLHCNGTFRVGDHAQRVGPAHLDGTRADFVHFVCYASYTGNQPGWKG
jgi:hypothetical protein